MFIWEVGAIFVSTSAGSTQYPIRTPELHTDASALGLGPALAAQHAPTINVGTMIEVSGERNRIVVSLDTGEHAVGASRIAGKSGYRYRWG